MKKIIISISCLLASIATFAGGNKSKVEEDGVLSNGFYFNLGMGMPNASITSYAGQHFGTFASQNLGTQANLELGNQWYFYTSDQIGFGLKASWAQFGFSTFKDNNKNMFASYYLTNQSPRFTTADIDAYAFDLKLIKIAPMFTYAVNDKFAVDASFEIAPTVNYFQEQEKGYTNLITKADARNEKVGTVIYGVTFAPGFRVRYSVFAIGYDYSFGSLSGQGTLPGASTDYNLTQKISNSRIYLGFQF